MDVAALLALPRQDRAELASMLLDSLEPEEELSEGQLEELRRLLAAYRANPQDDYSLEEIEAAAFPDS